MKTGIWGAGNIAHTHAEALLASGIPIGAVVDVSEEKARAFAEEFGIENWGTDPAVLLTDEKPPFMCVLLPISITIW